MGTCTYTAKVSDLRGGVKDYACANPAHRDGMCKFHLDGYLDKSTAGEVSDLFWAMHDGGAAGTTMDCTGYALPPLARKEAAGSVRRPLRLDRARFSLGGAGLSGITFTQPTSFRDAEFYGAAAFRDCTFKKGADFTGATFRAGVADFKSSKFGRTADFSRVVFFGAVFDLATLGRSRFNKAVFLGDASFHSATFESAADFQDASFFGGSKFAESEFGDGAAFRDCTFKKGADFTGATFRAGVADFTSSKFGRTADFFRVKLAEAVFDWAALAESRFNKAVFLGDASFHSATFESAADFHSTKFLGKSKFKESEFGKGADFGDAHFERPAYFRDVKMKRPGLVRFDGNVSNVSFLNTDLKEVCFGSRTTWSPQAQPDSRSIWDRKWRIYDERCLDDKSPDPALNLENVQSVYRDLRDNFDRQLRYDVSGGFFVREMEVGRKYKVDNGDHVVLKPICRRALTWSAAYNVLAEYGQSLKRPPLFLAPTLAAGSLLLWCGTGVLHGLEAPCEEGLGDSILRTLTAMVPLPLSGHLASPVDIGLKAAALPSVATFLIALRRRFEKTRRH